VTAPQYGQAAPGPPPDNNLVWAILSTIFCCLPLGVVAIVKSTQVSTLWAQGQYDASRKAAEDAKKFALWAAIAGVIVVVLYVIFFVLIGIGASNS
jgi:Interferon-induced transmembrane protein